MSELGFPGYESQAFLGVFAPMGTPAAVVKLLNAHLREIVAKPEFKKQMNLSALEPSYLDDAGFAKFLDEDRARWRVRLKAIGKLQ